MRRRGLTLIELLIVVAIVAVLAAIAVVNHRTAIERALKSSDAANLHTLATALQSYYVDYNELPPGDREAGPFMSHMPSFTGIQNGPASGGSWDGVPWMLYELHYVGDWKTLFNPKYLRLYPGGQTIRGGWPRYHNFRYAYNSSGLASGGALGGAGNINSGETWLLRDLWLGPEDGWWGAECPDYPGDYTYPWGEGKLEGKVEHVVYADMAVKTVIGGTDAEPTGE